jgi:hypothetical protein
LTRLSQRSPQSSDQMDCRSSRVSVRRVNRAYNRPGFALRTAKRLQAYGRGTGVGRGLGVGVVRVPGGVAVGVAVAVAVVVAVAVGVAVAVTVGVGVGVDPAWQKISVDAVGRPVLS